MNSKKIKIAVLAVVVSGFFVGQGCRKKPMDPVKPVTVQDAEQVTADDNNRAESVASDIDAIAAEAIESGNMSNFRESAQMELLGTSCATITRDDGLKIVTVDFGTGCVGQDGRTRSGKLIFDFSGSATGARYYRNPGFMVTVTSQNYVVDNHQVTIVNKTITNTTPQSISSDMNPGTNLTWSISATIDLVKPNNAGTISWTCSRTKELVNTSDTNCYRGQSEHIIWSKAIVKLNGTASGNNARNESYTSVATNLVRDFGCSPYSQFPRRHPFISGTLAYTPGSRPTRLVDFGNGTCDADATVTINNVVHNITLP